MMHELRDLRSQISDLKRKAEAISGQLAAWLMPLKETEIRGNRYLSRKADQQQWSTEEFLIGGVL